MSTTKIVLAFVAAIALPCVVFLNYTALNINERLFVDRFGCGCHPFFNTNHLSLLISSGVLFLSGLLWWPASGILPQKSRLGFRVFSAVASLWYLRFFMMHNSWL
jgi:hypothetical protein